MLTDCRSKNRMDGLPNGPKVAGGNGLFTWMDDNWVIWMPGSAELDGLADLLCPIPSPTA